MTTAGRWREPNPNLTPDAKVAWTAPARTGIQTWVATVGGKRVASIRRQPGHAGASCTASLDGWVWDNAGNPLGGPEAPARGFPSVPEAKKAIADAIRQHPQTAAPITWTDAPNGSSCHVDEQLVCQIRKLGVGGWSARWSNGARWDVRDQATQMESQSSRHFGRRDLAKRAVESALATGRGLARKQESCILENR